MAQNSVRSRTRSEAARAEATYRESLADTLPVGVRDEYADGFSRAVPHLSALACGKVDASSVAEQLAAARLLARYGFGRGTKLFVDGAHAAQDILDSIQEAYGNDSDKLARFRAAWLARLEEHQIPRL